MEKLIQDKQAALLHLIQHVGMKQVTRNGTNCKFYDYNLYQVLLNLLMEKGSPASVREQFNHLGWAGRVNVQNFLYEYAEVRSAAPVEPGQIFSFWNKANKFFRGVVLKVNESGCPVEYIALEEKDYDVYVRLVKEEIPLRKIYEIFDPETEPRTWKEDEEAAGFYVNNGNDSLRRLIRLQSANPDTDVKIGGVSYSLGSYYDIDIFRHLALNSPLEFRPAFFINDHSKMAVICNYFGEGGKKYEDADKLKYGTILFLKNNGIGVLLSNDAEGKPVIMLSLYNGVFQYCQVKREEIDKYWYPSVKVPQLAEVNNPAYKDVNGFIRSMILWWYTGDFGNKTLFKSEDVLNEKYVSPELIEMLKQGPDTRAGWRDYLASKGKGLLHNGTPVQAGDLLLFTTEEGINLGIALHKKFAVSFNYEYSQKLVWHDSIKDLLYVWRP
jgi:hypothetical protein